METTLHEREQLKRQGYYVKERCDACGKLLAQTFRYTIASRKEIYCSAWCRDKVLGGEHFAQLQKDQALKKAAEVRKCLECGGPISTGSRGDSSYCSPKCRKRNSRRTRRA